MERVSIADAAQRLGVSEVTVRRRIKRDELAAEKVKTASGFAYRVLLPHLEEMGGASQPSSSTEPAMLEAALTTLREELGRRSEENRRLQELLAREQEMVRRLIDRVPALPDGVPTRENTQRVVGTDIDQHGSCGYAAAYSEGGIRSSESAEPAHAVQSKNEAPLRGDAPEMAQATLTEARDLPKPASDSLALGWRRWLRRMIGRG